MAPRIIGSEMKDGSREEGEGEVARRQVDEWVAEAPMARRRLKGEHMGRGWRGEVRFIDSPESGVEDRDIVIEVLVRVA